ncbi:MAG: hypothetical protein EOM52_08505 [Clostridia bacterium]|nr:hypothetical protein [Clostridia bacterium]
MRIYRNADKDLCAPCPLLSRPSAAPSASFTAVLRDRDSSAPLDRAEYGLFQEGRLLSAAVSDASGALTFCGLSPGDYELRELAPAPGYLSSATAYPITVDADCCVYLCGESADGRSLPSVFLPRLRFYLLDALTASPLACGRFRLSNGAEAVSGCDGLVDLGYVLPGTYTLRQISAPCGHAPIPRSMGVSVGPGGKTVVNGLPLSRFTACNPPCSPE